MTALRKLGSLLTLVAVAVVVLWLGSDEDSSDRPGVEAGDTDATTQVDRPSDSSAIASLLALAVPNDDRTWRGTVEHISDGDTLIARVTDPGQTGLRVGEELRVRLLRIDTPEEERDGTAAECWSAEATAELERLAPEDSEVTFQYDEEAQDQYGRELAHVWNGAGEWVNGHLLANGAARMVTYRPNTAHDVRVTSIERAAQVLRAGMWGAC